MIPDAPWIRKAETEGVGDPDPVFCPRCTQECETIYMDEFGEEFGCEKCIRTKDAWEWREEIREAEREEFEEHNRID